MIRFHTIRMASTEYDYGRVFEPCAFLGHFLIKIQMKSELIEADTYNQQDPLESIRVRRRVFYYVIYSFRFFF